MEHRSKYADGAWRIAEQWPYLRYLGMGAWWGWIWLCYNSVALFAFWPEGARVGGVGLMYLYSTSAIALVSVVAALLWQRTTLLLGKRGLVLGVSLLATAGVLLVAYSPFAGGASDALFAIGGVLTGAGTSILCFKTGEVFGTLGRREVLTAGSVSLMFSAFLYFMGIGIPTVLQPAFVALMPFLSAFLFIMPGDDPYPADIAALVRNTEAKKKTGRRSFVNLVLASVMIAATAGFGKGLSAASMDAVSFATSGQVITLCVFVIAAGICFVVNSGDIVRAVRRVYAVLIVFGVAVILLSVMGVDLVYLNIGKEALWMVFTCLMAYMVFRFDFSPTRAFGIGQASYLVASALFWWVGMLSAPALEVESVRTIAMLVMVFAIVLVYAVVFNDSDIKFILTWHHNRTRAEDAERGEGSRPALDETSFDTASAAQEAERELLSQSMDANGQNATGSAPGKERETRPVTLHDRIAAIPEQRGISLREAEVMEYFAQGRSANWIAEELVISKNTVRSHIRSIYTKLDVHTRQELLDFLKTV